MYRKSRPSDRQSEAVMREGEESRALSARSTQLRQRNAEVLARSRRLRELCASLSARIATLVRGRNRIS
jgi:hypothetical protein